MIMATIMAGGIMIMGSPVHTVFLIENGIFLLTVSVVITEKEYLPQYIKVMLTTYGEMGEFNR